jgi:YbgC/YbaW family acyl-CoA thioester hydrolase
VNAPSVFRHRHRVSYAECTVGNHIYHSRYLDLLEAARGEFMRHAGHPLLRLQDAGYIFPVIEARLRYHRPARYDDVLVIELRLTELSRLRLGVHHLVVREDGVRVVEAETLHVCTGLEEKPRRMPVELVEALRPWVGAVPG